MRNSLSNSFFTPELTYKTSPADTPASYYVDKLCKFTGVDPQRFWENEIADMVDALTQVSICRPERIIERRESDNLRVSS